MRLGAAELALKDCDTALLLLEPTDGAMVTLPNGTLAKAHFHRGKSLMALNRPQDALLAYTQSRRYTQSRAASDEGEWPKFLVEYVHQAEAAVQALEAERRAEANFEATVLGTTTNRETTTTSR